MTGPYEWNPMPHRLDVKCPVCASCCSFEFVQVVRIKRKSEIPFFQSHKLFEYEFSRDAAGNGWHAALFYPGLQVSNTAAITELPEGYLASDWDASRFLYRSHGTDLGAVNCAGCGTRRKHVLSWPADAFYQVEYRGKILWAFHRESATELRHYIQSKDRERSSHKWELFLRHIPSGFLEASAREQVTKLLDQLLTTGERAG